MTRFRASAVAMIAVLLLTASWSLVSASAQQPDATPTAAVDASPSPAATKAEQINALIAGKLSTDIDAASLFTNSLTDTGGTRLRWVISMMGDSRLYDAARKDPASLAGLSTDDAKLAIAQAGFLRLPASRRAAILASHERRQAEARRLASEAEQSGRKIEALRQTISGLQAFLDGKPTPPSSLAVNLLEPAGVVLVRDRRESLLAAAPQKTDTAQSAAVPPEIAADPSAIIARLTRQVDDLYRRILSLPPAEQARLAAIQRAAGTQNQEELRAVERANQQLAAANAAAAQANSETDRLIASEQQRLSVIKQLIAASRLDLARQTAQTEQVAETSLGWRRQVNDVAKSSGPAGAADALYLQLIDALRGVRKDLAASLSLPTTAAIAIPVVPPLDSLLPPNDPRTAALQRLNRELSADAGQLSSEADAAGWARRAALYQAMAEMNGARLALIPSLSGEMRARVTGFDEEGLAQVRRELNQIVLTVRYNVALGVERFGQLGSTSLRPGSDFVFGVIELLVVVALFRMWRRRGDPLLGSIERGYATRRPVTLGSSFLALAVGVIRKVRRPLDWLLLILAIRWLLPRLFELAVLDIIWLVLVWFLAAAVMVQLIDAVAQGDRQDDPRANLRRRSLRLVIGAILGVGLVLSLTAASVGHGAIYSWVLSFCWFLIVPVVVLLANWWRERIGALAALGSSRSAVLAWSSNHSTGLSGTLGRILAGGLLLFQGAQTVVARRISQLALIREISGQRARERATARVVADEASGRYSPIPLEQAERLTPHGRPVVDMTDHVPFGHTEMPAMAAGQLIVVVGERGLGKTTAMAGLLAASPLVAKIELAAGTSGFEGITSALADKLGCKADIEAIKSRLTEQDTYISVDDVQRLIVPAIGGLTGLDKLIALARSTGSRTAWAFAIGGPAWSYLSRARADRALFDDVVILKRWTLEEIVGLIERRTDQAGLSPVFNLENYNAGAMLFDSEILPEERARRGYFEELTSQCDGNPAVALEFWRRSLFVDQETGSVSVRTYRAPDLSGLTVLPPATQFVLRAILQMEIAAPSSIVRSTDLSEVVVGEALRALSQLGVIYQTGDAYRLSLYWYQDVRRLLERQNLIVRSVS